jgi:hypothetical protein
MNLFGHLSHGFLSIRKNKSAIVGQEIFDEIGLLEILTQILDRISDEEWRAVFRSWIECLQNITDANGDSLS